MQHAAAQPQRGRTACANTPDLGQVFTPPDVAQLLASHLAKTPNRVRILDAGAGAGALCDAVLASDALSGASSIELTAVERDPVLASHLQDATEHWSSDRRVRVVVTHQDFVEMALEAKAAGRTYDIIVTNPPYVRLRSSMSEYEPLKAMGVKVPNLYAAFLWLAADLLAPNGQIVSITPRSFCSGRLFQPLRRKLRSHLSLESLHLFESREAIFERDGVLQEALISKFVRREQCSTVLVSKSFNANDPAIEYKAAREAVLPPDGDYPICIPSTDSPDLARGRSSRPIIALPVVASTGSVVDFRMKNEIVSSDKGVDAVPLIGSEAVRAEPAERPLEPTRYLRKTEKTAKHIYPPGDYIVVGRISPKEAVPRIRAKLLPTHFSLPFGGVAFENHVNVIHLGRQGLDSAVASEILTALRDPGVEEQFVERSGTTQVNLADLRALRFPSDDTEGELSRD